MTGVRLLDYWSPPDGAGAPVACLATTFTFESDFFAQDCLSRFLSLSTAVSEGDSIAAVLEEEDRLSEAHVSVLVDRSSPAEKRNLRWDLVPVGVPGGLLHAKVAALLWERSARILLGSANLTSAGYRRQVELALAIDLDDDCRMPQPFVDDLVAELRHLVELAPGTRSGAKGRAMDTVERLATRVEALALPATGSTDLRLAVAPAGPGTSPLDRLSAVWRGTQPLRATVLSPFWDDDEKAPAIAAVRDRLTGRPASGRSMTFVVAVDPVTGAVQAPASLTTHAHAGATVTAFDPPDADELRGLHAKLMLVESDEWLAALIGSSNATEAGLGLHPHHGHRELNVWLGCPASSKTAKHLRALARVGDQIDLDDAPCEPQSDEDEPTTPELPTGFIQCAIHVGSPPQVLLELDVKKLPASWRVRTPAGQWLGSAEDWRAAGSPESWTVDLPDGVLPSYLMVHWDADDAPLQATWTANVADRGALPPPAELADLSVEVLLAALASTRPLPIALEHELRRRQRTADEGVPVDLDPLHRFDDSGLLLQRARHVSLALWRLQERLGRPTTSIDAVRWRLQGPLGPLAIADGLVRAARERQPLPGETQFLLAELALTVVAADWGAVTDGVGPGPVRALVAEVLTSIKQRLDDVPAAPDPALNAYVHDALIKASQW